LLNTIKIQWRRLVKVGGLAIYSTHQLHHALLEGERASGGPSIPANKPIKEPGAVSRPGATRDFQFTD
jgi:hypothetical protein